MIQYKLQPYSIMELGQRANQEDSMFPALGQSTGQDRLFVLCDGMGGHAKGEVASAAICEAMSSYILARWTPDQPLDDFLFNEALNAAFDALDARDTDDPKKMGSTMTFLCFHAHGVTVAHIGDSRVYQLRPATGDSPARVVFKTRDHSLVNDLVAVGEITEEEARNHPQKNVITRAMQPHQPYRVKADIKHITDVKVGDYFYMCSDGMLEQTSDDNLLFIIFKDDTSNEDKVEMLREVTRDNRDNHTAHLIQVTGVEGTIPARVQQVTSTMTAQPSQQNGTPMNAYGGRPQQTAGNYHSTSAPSVVSGVAHKDKGASKQRIIVIALLAIVAALLLVIALKMFVFGDDKKEKQDGKEVPEQVINHDKHESSQPAEQMDDKAQPSNNTQQDVSTRPETREEGIGSKEPSLLDEVENAQGNPEDNHVTTAARDKKQRDDEGHPTDHLPTMGQPIH